MVRSLAERCYIRPRLSFAPPCPADNSAHVLGNTCSHGSCNANECSGTSAEDELLDTVTVREEKHHKAVLEEHPGKRKRFDDGLSTDHDEGSKTKRSVQHE